MNGTLWNRRYAVLALVLIGSFALPWAVFADTIRNYLDESLDASYETLSLVTGDSNTGVEIAVVAGDAVGSDGDPGCNIDRGEIFQLKASSSDSAVATVHWTLSGTDTVEFSGCGRGNLRTLTVQAGSTPGTSSITFSIATNTTGPGVYNPRADFHVTVVPPSNTPPSGAVIGVAHGETYEIGAVPIAGCVVQDVEDGAVPVAPTLSVVDGPLASYGLGSQTATCSYTDAGGLSLSASATYSIVDTHVPVIDDLGPTTAPDGAHGWYKSVVTNRFRAFDAGTGFAAPTTNPYEFSQASGSAEGSAVQINSGPAADVAGNMHAGINSATFKIDRTPPSLNIDDPNAGTDVDVCMLARPTFAPSDSASGLDGTAGDSWTTPATASGVGRYTYTAHAQDVAGWQTRETRTYNVTYGAAYTGIQQPINLDGSSRFALRSTVPVKFQLMCGTTPITNAVATLTVNRGDTAPDPGVATAISTAAATTNNTFRYDSTSQQYIFNLSTMRGYLNPGATTPIAFAPGIWTLGINFDDGTSRTVVIQLVKNP